MNTRAIALVFIYMQTDFIIETDKDVDRLRDFIKDKTASIEVFTFEQLSQLYLNITGRSVIDHREDSIYTNIEAQEDPDFWAEQETICAE